MTSEERQEIQTAIDATKHVLADDVPDTLLYRLLAATLPLMESGMKARSQYYDTMIENLALRFARAVNMKR